MTNNRLFGHPPLWKTSLNYAAVFVVVFGLEFADNLLVSPNELFDADERILENGVKIVYMKADYDINNNDPAQFEDILKNMTPEDIQDFVVRMFDSPDIIDVIFEPK